MDKLSPISTNPWLGGSVPMDPAWHCFVCKRVLDVQGVERGSRIVYDLFCHGCGTHITARIKL